jgi:cation/acetate symporter
MRSLLNPQAERALSRYPKTPTKRARVAERARRQPGARRAADPACRTLPRPTEAAIDIKRNNFLALVFCLMLGTAALPHILMRSYTTPSVQRGPHLGVLDAVLHPADLPDDSGAGGAGQVRHLHLAGGQRLRNLPDWISYWANIDKVNPLISITDINRDGIVQLAEIAIDGDVLVLATPEIAGLPYVISGWWRPAAWRRRCRPPTACCWRFPTRCRTTSITRRSTRRLDPEAGDDLQAAAAGGGAHRGLRRLAKAGRHPVAGGRRVFAGRLDAVSGAGAGRVLEARQPRRRAGRHGGRLRVCMYYMLHTNPDPGRQRGAQWFHIAPISAGVFGVPAGMAVLVAVSLLTPAPDAAAPAWSTISGHRKRVIGHQGRTTSAENGGFDSLIS